jgi:hypothetical protein
MRFRCFVSILFIVTGILACTDPVGFPVPLRGNYSDDYTHLVHNSAYPAVGVTGVRAIKQEVSCGYACIEMLAAWQGNTHITEASLLAQNDGDISTAMGSGFLREMTRQFPAWEVTRCVNVTNTELLESAYASLKNGFPVPVEFAAKNTDGQWTLHFGIVTAMDFVNSKVVVQNPYGYEETYTVQDFIRATRYECYEDMEWYFQAGFNMGLFHKNTIYLIANK